MIVHKNISPHVIDKFHCVNPTRGSSYSWFWHTNNKYRRAIADTGWMTRIVLYNFHLSKRFINSKNKQIKRGFIYLHQAIAFGFLFWGRSPRSLLVCRTHVAAMCLQPNLCILIQYKQRTILFIGLEGKARLTLDITGCAYYMLLRPSEKNY